jgi:cyclic beta-1,2-glucan synthetase
MYRAGLESLLGFRVRGARLLIDPCIPRAWPGFSVAFRHGSARYEVVVENPEGVSRGVSSLELDGRPVAGPAEVVLADDGAAHRLRVVLGKP